MDREALEKRKKIVYEFICDDLYVPMKAKEIAMILQVSKEQREELQGFRKILNRCLYRKQQRLWLCDGRG